MSVRTNLLYTEVMQFFLFQKQYVWYEGAIIFYLSEKSK